ncbi:MAG: efflux RND transporter periplasmic adaptor subunit [Omnitrophica bacterium]|nr:efflux RND transporter periplasmic adaptor subunit [Candidatus Omnitrophota bacterium]
MKKLKRIFVLIIIAALLAGLALSSKMIDTSKILSVDIRKMLPERIRKAIFKKTRTETKPTVLVVSEAIPVKVYETKRVSFKDTLPVMGNIKGFKEIDLKFETSGILENFNFEEGEKIQEGDIIANLTQKDAILKLKYAELEVEKTKKLFDIGGIGRIKLEQSKLEYGSAKSDFEKTNIYAILDGVLGRRDTDVGSYVTPNDKIGVFIDISDVYAEFNVIEKDSPKLKLGQDAEVFVDAYPNKSYKGTVDSIAPIVEGRTRTQALKIELENPEYRLKPGMFARALIATFETDNALTIPTSAFKKKDSDYFVYIVHKTESKNELGAEGGEKEPVLETGLVEIRKVEIEYLTQDVALISKGLGEGELIVVEAFQEFNDKDEVEINEVQESIF